MTRRNLLYATLVKQVREAARRDNKNIIPSSCMKILMTSEHSRYRANSNHRYAKIIINTPHVNMRAWRWRQEKMLALWGQYCMAVSYICQNYTWDAAINPLHADMRINAKRRREKLYSNKMILCADCQCERRIKADAMASMKYRRAARATLNKSLETG